MKLKFNIYSFALGFVFLVFSLWQLTQPGYWLAYFPDWIESFALSKNLIIKLNGIFDFIVGICLILGIYPLIFSALASIHLFGVILIIGVFNDIAVRDIGLLLLAIGIFLDNLKKK